jgi:hypothetical protein
MNFHKIFSQQEKALSEEAQPHQQDVKSLWDRWDKAQQEETPSDLVRGYNLVGIGLILAGSLLQLFSSSGLVKYRLAPIVILIGAAIITVKKVKALWLQRSSDR